MTEFKSEYEMISFAILLYNDGWRASDCDQIKSEYDFKYDADVNKICKILYLLDF